MEIDIVDLITIATCLLTIARIIARYTKTTRDDVWTEKARKFLEDFSNLWIPDRK